MSGRIVYKYPMGDPMGPGVRRRIAIPMGSGSRIVLVADQGLYLPTIWVEHQLADADTEPTHPPFSVVAHDTGLAIPADGRRWIGSVCSGPFVWHLYGWWGDTPAPNPDNLFLPRRTPVAGRPTNQP